MEIASISIGTGLNITGALDDLKRFTDRPEVRQAKVQIAVGVIDRELVALNKHLELKRTDLDKTVLHYRKNPIVAKVDDRALTGLNRSLEESTGKLRSMAQQFKQIKSTGNLSVTLKTESSRGGNGKNDARSSGQWEQKSTEGFKRLEEATRKVEQATRANKPSFLGSLLHGASQSFGFQLSTGIQRSLRKDLGIDLRKFGKAGTKMVSEPIAGLITKNPELQKSVNAIGQKLEARVGAVGQIFADALIDAVDESGATISEKLSIFIGKAFKDFNGKQLAQDIVAESQTAAKDIGQSIAKSPYAQQRLERFGETLTQRRERLLKERGIPLVQERAAEILQQKRSKNSAKQVTDNTQEVLIMTGGYAKARGLSGATIEKRMKEAGATFGEEVVRIWVKNTDTDISEDASVARKAGELLWSLGKPNIRGYSKDSIEMAAQALAAIERNPDAKIKLMGESGGGYVAEEAARLLELLGVKGDRLEFLGVGTPNFIGAPKARTGKKIISPDDYLGAEVEKLYAPYGFAQRADRDVLGVKGHPIENYAEAQIAELQNFLKSPEILSDQEIQQVKQAANQFKQTDTSQMSSRELASFSEMAFKNLQMIRQQVLVATEDTIDELQSIANTFEQVYLATSEGPEEFKTVRGILQRGSALIGQLEGDRGVESGRTASVALNELKQVQSEFEQKFEGAIGTVGLKAETLRNELGALIMRFDDPSLSVKPRTPVVIPTVERDMIEVMPDGSSGSGKGGGMIEKVKHAIAKRAQDDIDKIKEGIVDAVIDRINDKLMRVPGQPDLLDPSRQVGAIDELKGMDYLKAARVDIEDTLRSLLVAGSKGYSIAKGGENALMSAVPPLAVLKALAQKIGLPIAAFSAAGALPGVGAAEHALTGLTEGLLSLPAEQLATTMSGAFADAISTTIANLPVIGGKLAPAMTETITQLLLNAAGGAAEVGAEIITPIVGGQIMLGAAGTAAKSAMPALPEASIAKNKQLQAATEQQIKIIGRAMETAKALLPVNPQKAQTYIAGIKKEYPQIGGQIDEAIGQLPSSDRMLESTGGARLARLKAEFAKAVADMEKAEQKATKLAQIIGGWADIIQNPMDAMQRQVQGTDIIDVDFEEVRSQQSQLALPDAKARMQEQFNQIVSASAAQIRDLGEEFSRQSQSLKSNKLAPKIKAEVAAAIDASTLAARKAIDELLAPFGKNVPKEIKEAARSARQRITKADTSAQGSLAQAKEVGTAIPEGMNAGIDSRLAVLKQSAEAMAEVVIAATENKLEIKSPSRVFQTIGQMVVAGFQLGLQGMNQATQFIDDFLDEVEQKLNLAKGTFAQFGNTIKVAAAAFLAFKAIDEMFIPQMMQFATAVRDAGLEFERFERIMKFVTGSSREAQESLSAIKDEANRLGVDLRTAIEGQSGLMAAARGTILEGAATDQIAAASRDTAAVLSMTTEEVGRMNKAFEQMMTKGLRAEELKQQLGDVLPGSMSIAARAIGVTNAELEAMMKNGELGIDSLVKFTQQLELEMSSGVTDAAGSAQASMNRFGNAIYQVQATLGKQMLPVQSMGLDALTNILNGLPGLISVVSKLLLGFAVKVLGTMLVNSAIDAAKSLATVQFSMTGFVGGLQKAAIGIKKLVATIAPIAGQLLIFAAISDAITLFGMRNGDAAEASKDFAESANKGLREYLELMGQASDKTGKLGDRLENLPKSFAEDTLLGGGLIKLFMGEEKGTEFLRRREQDIARGGAPTLGQDIVRLFGGSTAPKDAQIGDNPYFTPRSEKTAQNVLRESQAGAQAAGAMMQSMSDMLARYRQGGGSLRQLRSIDVEMRDLASRKALTPASDTNARRAIDTRFAELTKQRETLSKQVNFLPTQIKQAIEGYKATNEEIKDTLAKGGLSPATAKKLQDQLEANNKAIEDGQKALQDFNSALNLTIETAKKLEFQFKQISLLQEAGQRSIEIQSAESMTRVNALQLSGQITPGQAQSAQAISEQQQAVGNIANLGQTIDRLNGLLSGTGVSRVFGMTGLQQGASSTQISEKLMQLQLQGVDPDTEEFKILQQAQEAQAQVEQLKVQQAQATQQLTQSQVQVQETVRQTTREINDFVRGIGRNIQEIGLTIEQLDLETEVQRTKNEIQENLSGFSDRFFGEFISGIEEMVDLLNEPIKRMIDARQTAIQLQQQAQDAQMQANELQRSAMSGASGNVAVAGSGGQSIQFSGIQITSGVDASGEPGFDYVVSNGDRGAQFGSLTSGQVIETITNQNWETNLESNPGGQRGYGNRVIVRSVDQVTGEFVDLLYAHLDNVAVQVGQQVGVGTVLGTQGRTGSTTGAHVSVDFFGRDLNYATPAALSLRDRTRDALAAGRLQVQQIAQPQNNAAPFNRPSSATGAGGSGAGAYRDRYLNYLAQLESGGRGGQGYAEVIGGGYAEGLFQFTPITVQDYRNAGLPGDPRYGTAQEQAQRAWMFIERFHPDAARAIDAGNFQEANRLLGGRWASLPGSQWDERQNPENYRIAEQYLKGERSHFSVFSGGGAATAGGTTNLSVPGADTSSINPALGALSSAHTQQMQSVYAQIEQQDRSTAIRLRQSFEKRKRELEDARREIEDEARQYNERYQDVVLEAFGDTQLAQVLSRITQVTRESEQNVRQQTLAIRDAKVSLENLTELRDEIKSNPALEPLRQLLPEMDQTIITYQNKLDELEEAKDREERILNERRDAILRNLRETQENEMRSLTTSGENLSIQRQALNIRDSRLQGLIEARSQRAQITQQYDEQLRTLNKELEQTMRGIQRLEQEGFKADSTELVTANEELEHINNQIAQLEANRGIELDIVNQQSLDRLREYNREMSRSIVDAQVTQLGYRRDVFGANQLQRRSGTEQLNYDYSMQMNSIDSLQQQMMGQEGYDENMFAKMRSDAEALNNVSLENLRQQFPDLADTLNQTAFAAFENLGNSMAGVLQGTKSLGDAFNDFFDSIINSLVQMASQWAASELFGLFFPSRGAKKAKGGSADGIMGIASNVLSLIPGLDKGGLIPGRYTGQPDRHIARVNPGEFIMSRRAVAAHGIGKLSAMNNLQRFDRGGFVGAESAGDRYGRRYRDYSESSMSDRSSSPVEVKYSVTEINSVRYVSEEQFQEGLKKTSAQTEDRMRRSMRSKPSYRDDLGLR